MSRGLRPQGGRPLPESANVAYALGVGSVPSGRSICAALGVSAMASLATLRYVVPYRMVFLAVTLLALGLAHGTELVGCDRRTITRVRAKTGAQEFVYGSRMAR